MCPNDPPAPLTVSGGSRDRSREEGALIIRPLEAGEVDLLDRHLPGGLSGKHADRFAAQQVGVLVYLIAWLDALPVGHLLLRWDGPEEEPMASDLVGCPEIQDLFVAAAHRNRGIGSRLLDRAEALADQWAYTRVGLSVGLSPAYDAARSIYRRRAYREAGFGVLILRWRYRDEDGEEWWWEEACTYLVKEL